MEKEKNPMCAVAYYERDPYVGYSWGEGGS